MSARKLPLIYHPVPKRGAGRVILEITREQGGAPQARVYGSNLRTH